MMLSKYINWIFKLFFIAVFSTQIAQAQEPKNRNDWQSFVKIARQAYGEKDYQRALLYYQNATLKAPESIDLTNEIAQTHYRLNQMDQAKEWYGRSKKEAANEFNKGNVAYKQKAYQESVEHYKNALRKNPEMSEARYNLSMAMKEMKQNPPPPPQNPKNNPPQPPNDPKNKPEDEQNNSEKSSGLSGKSVERLLNQLAKNEAETKRKINNGNQKSNATKSEKNW
jgi:tetratricopeptide (TPR) repeat protein